MRNFLFAIAIIPLLIVGCSSDDDFDFELNTLYGEWRVTHIELEGEYFDVTTPVGERVFEPTYATFNSDGTYTGRGEMGYGSGTYKAKGKTLTTYLDGEEFIKYEVLSLTGTQAELIMHLSASSSIKIKVRKQ